MNDTLKFYMKSGNVVELRDIAHWKFTGRDGLSGVEIREGTDRGVERIVMVSLRLDEVEAVTVIKGTS